MKKLIIELEIDADNIHPDARQLTAKELTDVSNNELLNLIEFTYAGPIRCTHALFTKDGAVISRSKR